MNKKIQPTKNESKPKEYEFTLMPKYLELIRSGKKTSEGRINSGAFRDMKAGDKIKFFDKKQPSRAVYCEVIGNKKYKSFEEMLEGEGVENMLPGCESLEAGVKIYERIPGYTERCEEKGCVAIQIKVIRK